MDWEEDSVLLEGLKGLRIRGVGQNARPKPLNPYSPKSGVQRSGFHGQASDS